MDAAVLLIHGFTGTPDSLRHLANHLNSIGFHVSAPLLNGHGKTRENLAKSDWKSWHKTCQTEFVELKRKHANVFIAGLSLGGVLGLKLAEQYPQNVTGLSCLATPAFLSTWVGVVMPFIINTPLKFIYPYQKKIEADVKDPIAKKNYWSIMDMPITCIHSLMKLQRIVRHNLTKVTCPTLLIHSRYDSTAPYESMNYIAKHISSKTTETITLENSFHLITIDYEKDLVNQKVGEFFLREMKR